MILELSDEAAEYGRQARRALEAAGGDDDVPLLQRVRDQLDAYVHLSNRLDRGASGAVLFALDADTLLALVDDDTKLVFACSPNNPTGTLYHEQLDALATALAGRSVRVPSAPAS